MQRTGITFTAAAARLEAVLRGSARGEILDALMPGDAPDGALARLRRAMHAHTFPTGAGSEPVSLRSIVDSLDARTRREGLHVLQGWDYIAHRFPDEIAPVLMIDYCARVGVAHDDRKSLTILLDQYFLSLLSLLAVRAWDDGDPNANLDRVTDLLRDLRGPQGSGDAFVEDAETLLLLAVSYFHPEECGYDAILDRIRTLDAAHQLRCALPCAAIMGTHLRWGLRFMYRRDVGLLRADNEVDYRWLLFSLLTLMRRYSPGDERVAEGLLGGLSADPWAFIGKAPAFLRGLQAEHDEFRDLLGAKKADLLRDFEALRPDAAAYSPLSFATNFLSNAAVAMVVVALRDDERYPPLDALLSGERGVAESAERLATKLMEYSVANAEQLAGRGAPLVVLDRFDGAHSFNAVVRVLRES